MKNTLPLNFSLIIVLLIFLSGCQKFDRGGLRSKGDQRITSKIWKMEKCELVVFDTMYYTVENNFINHFTVFNWDPTYNKYTEITDVTNDVLIKDLNLNFNENGVLELNCLNNNTALNEVGSWRWSDETNGVVSGGIFTNDINNIQLTDSLLFNPEFIWISKLKNNKLEIRIRTSPDVNYNLERFIETYRFSFKGI